MNNNNPIDPDKLSEAAKQLMQNRTFRFDYPIFEQYNTPNGFLAPATACHALFWYALIARRAYEENVQGWAHQYEGNLSNTTNFRDMYLSVAFLYGVTPEEMQRYWPAVDMQFVALNLPQLPKEDRYRHDSVPEFKTQ